MKWALERRLPSEKGRTTRSWFWMRELAWQWERGRSARDASHYEGYLHEALKESPWDTTQVGWLFWEIWTRRDGHVCVQTGEFRSELWKLKKGGMGNSLRLWQLYESRQDVPSWGKHSTTTLALRPSGQAHSDRAPVAAYKTAMRKMDKPSATPQLIKIRN